MLVQANLSDEIRAAIQQRIRQYGLAAVAREVGVAKPTLSNILAGVPIQRGSVAMIEGYIKNHSKMLLCE